MRDSTTVGAAVTSAVGISSASSQSVIDVSMITYAPLRVVPIETWNRSSSSSNTSASSAGSVPSRWRYTRFGR